MQKKRKNQSHLNIALFGEQERRQKFFMYIIQENFIENCRPQLKKQKIQRSQSFWPNFQPLLKWRQRPKLHCNPIYGGRRYWGNIERTTL